MEKGFGRSWFSLPCLKWGNAELELGAESVHIQPHHLRSTHHLSRNGKLLVMEIRVVHRTIILPQIMP